MLFNLLLNIGLLVLIATMLTNLPPVRALLLEEKQTFRSRLWLSLIFGMVSICSTYIGVPIQGAIVNTRVIGVMAAGLLGGPYVGVGAALIGGIHRYLFDIGGFYCGKLRPVYHNGGRHRGCVFPQIQGGGNRRRGAVFAHGGG